MFFKLPRSTYVCIYTFFVYIKLVHIRVEGTSIFKPEVKMRPHRPPGKDDLLSIVACVCTLAWDIKPEAHPSLYRSPGSCLVLDQTRPYLLKKTYSYSHG